MPTQSSEALEAARMQPERSLQTGKGSALKGILVNIGLGSAKLMAGLLGHSYALIADACESFGDVLSSSVTFYALKKASEPADDDHPVGHGRAETLAAMGTAFLLIGVGALIFWQAAVSLYEPRHAPNPLTLLGPTLHELMEGSVDPALLKFITETSAACPGIKGIDKVWVRKLGMRLIVDLHVEVDPDISVQDGHRLAHEVKGKLQHELPQVRDVMVHIEPFDPDRPRRPYRIQSGGMR
jgi:divalent metal cation (Fe/Co/Zn/Cd) transporter